jgi:hypothetical protein
MTQKRAAGADVWFVTLEDMPKLRDIEGDPHVNLSYYKDRTREWVSVFRLPRSRDRQKIHEPTRPGRRGSRRRRLATRHEDPRMVLIGVTARAVFLEVTKAAGHPVRAGGAG